MEPKADPKLVALAGPLEGMSFSLAGDEFSVGREPSCQLSIEDRSVSRRHCVITQEGEQFRVRDLESHNGTLINDVPMRERLLEDGDRIRIGSSLFLFLLSESAPATVSNEVQLNEDEPITASTLKLQRDDTVYLRPEKIEATSRPTARMARDLGSLLRISTTINSIRNLDVLQRQLLESIFEIIPAERAALLLMSAGAEEPVSAFALDKLHGPGRPVRVSHTIARQVFREGAAVLGNYIRESKEFVGVQSLVSARTSSLLCVPLALVDRALGVIYLDTSNPLVQFDEQHLQLATAIAGIASAPIDNAQRFQWLESENQRLLVDLQLEHNMVGESAGMQTVLQRIAKVAPTEATVLLRGESGTGKELAARAIHQNSARAGKPFVAINCAVLTETLLESELFGHERGAFTGAVAQKRGKLETADGGTLFLDELGELAPALQGKLLRVLQEREFERVGGTRPIKVDIRLVAATNRDLEKAVKDGTFRHDLYYRLSVIELTMPPLRERRDDVLYLANYFVSKYSKKCNRNVLGVSPEARACLINYDWPGNIRELENAIERAVVLGSSELILADDLPETILEKALPAGEPTLKYQDAFREAKKQIILKAIEQAAGNHAEAAKLLGIHPNNFYRLIRSLDLKQATKHQRIE
jgi:transcriptional regulator with GAF, ATPase, and Fis domain